MDYVYICRKGENEELRYSIRSVYSYTSNPRIVLFGHKPSWYTGEYVPISEGRSKFTNIHNAVAKISQSEKISNSFVLMNDDFFLLKNFDDTAIYNGGMLKDKIKIYKSLSTNLAYVNMLEKTYSGLQNLGIKNPIDYDIHVPFRMEKNILKETIKHKTLYRSTYGNLANIGGICIEDVKVYDHGPKIQISFDYVNKEMPFISTLDGSFDNVYNSLLRDRFPNPSPVEAKA